MSTNSTNLNYLERMCFLEFENKHLLLRIHPTKMRFTTTFKRFEAAASNFKKISNQ